MSEPDPAHRSTDAIPPEVLGEEDAEMEAFSFVVRVYRPTESDGTEFRGWVEHVQSEQRTHFVGLDRVLAIISEHIGVHSVRRDSRTDRLSFRLSRLKKWFGRQWKALQEISSWKRTRNS
jgi:hypothetical protein